MGGNRGMNFKTPIPYYYYSIPIPYYSKIFIKFGRVLVLLEKSERIILKLFY